MENLTTVLLSNGTGLLTGLCRVLGRYYDEGFEGTPHMDGPEEELLEIAFSVNEKSLGTFNLHIEDCAGNNPERTKGGFDCLLNTEELTTLGKRVWIEIRWGIHSDFARFAATLENIEKNYVH